jgi:hypothetical protein
VFKMDVPDMHDGTALRHTMKLLKHGQSFRMRLALLCHDMGKGVTDPEKHPHHHGHDGLGVAEAKRFLARLTGLNSSGKNSDVAFSIAFVENHMKIKRLHEMKPSKIIRFVNKFDRLGFTDDLIKCSFIDSAACRGADPSVVQREFNENVCVVLTLARSAISSVTGKDLIDEGVVPDENFGDKLLERRTKKLKSLIENPANRLWLLLLNRIDT